MKAAKRIAAGVMAFAMTVTMVNTAAPAKAQVLYETKQVYISTDLVPKDTDDISVEKDGSVSKINTITNVQFDLDCNVDCTWKVEPDKNINEVAGTSTEKVTIDDMGHVEVEKGATEGSYYVTATAKNISNKLEKTARCTINVDGTSDSAKASSIKLDTEKMNEQIEELIEDQKMVKGTVEVAQDGMGMTINGTVNKLKLYTVVEPAYLLKSDVNFENNSPSAEITRDPKDGTYSLLTTKAAAKNLSLYATAGIDKANTKFSVTINNVSYKAGLNCDNIPGSDKKDKDKFNVRLNEELDFYIDDNECVTMPRDTVNRVEWAMSYGDNSPIEDSAVEDGWVKQDGKVETDFGTFTFSNAGRSVKLETPTLKDEDKDRRETYEERLKKIGQIKIQPRVNYSYTVTEDNEEVEKSQNYDVSEITLSFGADENALAKVELDFGKDGADLEEGRDYKVITETLDKKETPVYYFETDERDTSNKIDLIAATVADVPGVREFQQSKDKNFSGQTSVYKVTYTLTDFAASEFGSANEKYMNGDIGQTDESGEIIRGNDGSCTLEKTGIGYKKLIVKATGKAGKEYGRQEYILRFVSDAAGMQLLHTDYQSGSDSEYNNNAVIHIRQGEADRPEIQISTADGMVKKDVTIYNPFLNYTFEVLKGDGTVVTATTDVTAGLKINGISEGKVLVTASSVVDEEEFAQYTLYVNDEIYTPDEIQIVTSDAASLEAMDGDYNVQGHQEDIPLGIRATGTNAGIPIVTWESSDPEFAKVTQDGKLTTLKSTGSEGVTITATSVSDKTKKASITLHIMDVYATGFNTISEKVKEGENPVVTSEEGGAGTCKAYTTFTLAVSDYIPVNQTKADGKISWQSSNPDVATIDENGVVVTLKEGTTAITATYTSGTATTFHKIYNLTVKGFAEVVTSIECESPVSLTRVGDSKTLLPTVLPENAVNKKVRYESLNPSIVSVTDTGVITAKAPGEATIVISAEANPSVKKEVKVTVLGMADQTPQNPGGTTPQNPGGTTGSTQQGGVSAVQQTPTVTPTPGPGTVETKEKKVSKPTIKLSKKTIKRKKTAKITIKNKAKGAKVTYTLNKKSKKIVSVSKKGVIKGKKKGTAKIVVKVVQNGKTYKKTLKIKVK